MGRPEISEGFTIIFFAGDEIAQKDRHIVRPSRAIEIAGENWNQVKNEGCTKIWVVRESDDEVIKIYE